MLAIAAERPRNVSWVLETDRALRWSASGCHSVSLGGYG